MKAYYIEALKVDDEFQDFFMVKSIAVKIGSNGKQYLDLTLSDKSGDISAKKWDVSEAEKELATKIYEGSLIKIKAIVTEWQGTKQLRVSRIRAVNEKDTVNTPDFVKAAPEPAEEMFRYIEETAEQFQDEELRKITLHILRNDQDRLMYYPAASKNHHAEMAGLLYHIKRMLIMAEKMCQVYPSLKEDLLKTGVILHDMEKINEILSNEFGISSGYSFEGQMLGHIAQGVKMIEKAAEITGLSREKAIMLEHMILSHHYEPEFGSPKKPLFPEAEMLHYLDIIDARMYDMEDALKSTEAGDFSDRVWTLDNRRLYKATF